MAVSVDVAGKLVNIDAVFKDRLGSVVAAPAGATYAWSVTAGGEFVTVEGTGAKNANADYEVPVNSTQASFAYTGYFSTNELNDFKEETHHFIVPIIAGVSYPVQLNISLINQVFIS